MIYSQTCLGQNAICQQVWLFVPKCPISLKVECEPSFMEAMVHMTDEGVGSSMYGEDYGFIVWWNIRNIMCKIRYSTFLLNHGPCALPIKWAHSSWSLLRHREACVMCLLFQANFFISWIQTKISNLCSCMAFKLFFICFLEIFRKLMWVFFCLFEP